MNTPIKRLTNLPRSRKLILGASAGLLVLSTSSVLAFNGLTSTGANDTPVETKVEDHEKRLTATEQDLADTKDRVGQVEEKTEANTQAIGTVERQITVVREQAEASTAIPQPAAESVEAPAPQQSALQPAPAPAPIPKNELLVVAMQQTEKHDRFGNFNLYECSYTVETGQQVSVFSGVPCTPVGAELSGDMLRLVRLAR
ncbi:hypothetical protein BXY47_3126 [Dietzia kunjamensis]|uniref:hypothetical protein n=1 Tax=Dietzia kunjamensis TaxID=322509 RepID=UPI000FF2E619|nr:hypothetical protein [Dietzia kunjamensis]MBB1013027.1 hypothetical protein [Dietzia kunjamensis]RKE58382.1 hypothetical protein BXY47_3126 [Dietzia kunjamensis]